MSRPIKFRAWDKKYPRFIEVGIEWGLSSNPLRIDRIDDFVFQEFTGLKDKNGVEVYEGDVLQDKNGKVFEVKWNDLYAAFGMRDPSLGRSSAPLRGLHPTAQLEIIGNIYEHPHLLNPTEQENK